MHRILQPEDWIAPKGYANGVAARGTLLFVGGQIGWNAAGKFETGDFVGQVRQALANVVAVLAAGEARPEHLTSMTWYFTDKRLYLDNLEAVGQAYREIVGKHYPAMAAVEVAALMEERALVEIQAMAVVPD